MAEDEVYEVNADGNFDITVPAATNQPATIDCPDRKTDTSQSEHDTQPSNGAATSSYYHFDSQGNKFKNKWDSFDVDAELAKVEDSEPIVKPARKANKQPRKPQKAHAHHEKNPLQFDPNDPMYKDMKPEQLEAIKMALSVSDEQIKAMPEKDQEMLTQFRQIHKQRMRSGAHKTASTAKDVKEEIKKQREAKAKEVKDPEEELKKLFTFLGTEKKWSTEAMPSSAGDGEARCPSEVSMIAETKKQEVKNAEINRLKAERQRWRKENTPPSLLPEGSRSGRGAKDAAAAFQNPSKLMGKISNTKSEIVRKKGKKKQKNDRKQQFSAIKKLAKSSKLFEFE